MAIKRIGILTGGGDVPGLNSVIKGVVYRGSEHDIEVVGIRRGWEGLTHVDLEDFASTQRYILPLNRENTRTIDRTGGTFLHSSRTNPSKMKSVPEFLNAADYPKRPITKSGCTFDAYDLSKKVLKTLDIKAKRPDFVGRDEAASPATGLARIHQQQQEALVRAALGL